MIMNHLDLRGDAEASSSPTPAPMVAPPVSSARDAGEEAGVLVALATAVVFVSIAFLAVMALAFALRDLFRRSRRAQRSWAWFEEKVLLRCCCPSVFVAGSSSSNPLVAHAAHFDRLNSRSRSSNSEQPTTAIELSTVAIDSGENNDDEGAGAAALMSDSKGSTSGSSRVARTSEAASQAIRKAKEVMTSHKKDDPGGESAAFLE
jgi:hypothetical protein